MTDGRNTSTDITISKIDTYDEIYLGLTAKILLVERVPSNTFCASMTPITSLVMFFVEKSVLETSLYVENFINGGKLDDKRNEWAQLVLFEARLLLFPGSAGTFLPLGFTYWEPFI